MPSLLLPESSGQWPTWGDNHFQAKPWIPAADCREWTSLKTERIPVFWIPQVLSFSINSEINTCLLIFILWLWDPYAHLLTLGRNQGILRLTAGNTTACFNPLLFTHGWGSEITTPQRNSWADKIRILSYIQPGWGGPLPHGSHEGIEPGLWEAGSVVTKSWVPPGCHGGCHWLVWISRDWKKTETCHSRISRGCAWSLKGCLAGWGAFSIEAESSRETCGKALLACPENKAALKPRPPLQVLNHFGGTRIFIFLQLVWSLLLQTSQKRDFLLWIPSGPWVPLTSLIPSPILQLLNNRWDYCVYSNPISNV